MQRWFLCVLLAGACGGTEDPLAERIFAAGEAARLTSRALGLTTAMYGISTISVKAPHEVIAESIRGRFVSETGTCAMVGGQGSNAILTLPSSTGCTLASAGMLAKGTINCTVSDGPLPFLKIACGLDLVVDGLPLAGNLDIFTELGNDYSFAVSLQGTRGDDPSRQLMVGIPNLAAGIAAQTSEASGNATVDGTPMIFAALQQDLAGCYPRGGTIEFGGGVLGFSNTTPQTGEAIFTEGQVGRVVKLAVRPGCPPSL